MWQGQNYIQGEITGLNYRNAFSPFSEESFSATFIEMYELQHSEL